MQAAQALCHRAQRDFPSLFRRQFCLSEDPTIRPDGWSAHSLGRRTLYHCPDLCVVPVLDRAGRPLGQFLGIGVTRSGRAVTGALRLDCDSGAADFGDRAEAEVAGIAGRYAVIFSVPGFERMYFDPVLDLSVVFDRESRTVASSLLLALNRPLREDRYFNHRLVLRKDWNYGLQHTRDAVVRRALPNHYLDLDSFVLRRHWPKGDEDLCVEDTSQLEEGIEETVTRLGVIFDALVRAHDCAVPVSGGNDSRNLLACGRGSLDRVSAFYSHRFNRMSAFDCLAGEMLMSELAQPHQVVNVHDPQHKALLSRGARRRAGWDFAFRTGYQSFGCGEHIAAAALAPSAAVVLRGNVMDILRANQYSPQTLEEPFDLRYGLSKLRMRPEVDDLHLAAWGPRYMNWFDTLPANAQARAYDFAFCEQLLPNTMGGTLYGYDQSFYMNPFSDRRLIELAIRTPPRMRFRGWMNARILRSAAAPLARIPRTNEIKKSPQMHLRVVASS